MSKYRNAAQALVDRAKQESLDCRWQCGMAEAARLTGLKLREQDELDLLLTELASHPTVENVIAGPDGMDLQLRERRE